MHGGASTRGHSARATVLDAPQFKCLGHRCATGPILCFAKCPTALAIPPPATRADDKLLEGKGLQERIQPYADREANVAAFVSSCKRSIRCQTGPLRDPEEPTLAETDAGVEALVASEETVKGGLKINEGRAKRGFAPLVLVVVPVIGAMSGDSKLSSTSLRRQELEAEQAVR